MFVAREIHAEHKDLIHDVSYDYHGRRMATCSSDQSVKVWDLDKKKGEWICTASWKTHSGSVWKVTWAHPEFGQVLASCSFDRTAAVWEEQVVGTGDGILRGQSHWNEIQHKLSCSCVSWNPSRVHAPMLAVGSDDRNTNAGGKVQIHEYNEASRSVQCKDIDNSDLLNIYFISIMHHRDQGTSAGGNLAKLDISLAARFSDHESQVWRVEWNVTGTILASSGDDGRVRLWKANYLDNWKSIAVLRGDGVPSFTSGPSNVTDKDPKEAGMPSVIHQRMWYS
ncbi:PREDICTED: nucleoporin seh1-like [Acropora digitifera]|uniref:nucleoporin seh1-like n=1 Tax=Acropora digitifera TaxID=70779 RepID=UPI00077AE12F|nr:PREDICTED: nucleoporin seh1-like [Acropora digitifera]